MRLAIGEAVRNPAFPFGAVIVRTADGAVLARGVNTGAQHPLWHGEVVAMNDYVARHGNRGWEAVTLYTTGEPCPMCMGALVWAGVRRVVWGTSIAAIRDSGIDQITLGAAELAARAPFHRVDLLLGGVLAHETDALFAGRPR
ncbi:nucleoside deaminase [Azospirillum halopraeferens]|uniref:nucleoside deaminase n=1 Tax=Azospirillum halopraeferens TaxID=34010 RepID=UPI000405CF64|nr:nucleoside deaminase [Azospirillum halopraeferens]